MEPVNVNEICIGLFGTCDNVRWRDSFMSKYDELGIKYFNPMVDDWHAGLAAIEAQHLAQDQIIVLPTLAESYGSASLNEVAFGPLKALLQNKYRSFIFLIDDDVTDALKTQDPVRAKDSFRSRKLVKAHLKGLGLGNVYLVDTLEQMLNVSLTVHNIHMNMREVQPVIA